MKKVDYYNLYVKSREKTYYQRSKETILIKTKNYYDSNKEVLRGKEKYVERELSKERNNIMEEIDIVICLKKKNAV